MKKILKLTTVLLLIGVLFSCETDRFPQDEIALNKSLKNIDDAAKWNTGFIASFRSRQYGIFVTLQDRQADQLNATSEFGNRGGAPHSWINFNSSDYDLRDVWQYYYGALKNINSFLTLSEKLQLTDEDAAVLKNYQGNAHFIRAYYFFNLAIRYGKPYKEASASSDLCVPLTTVYDPNAKPERATNEAVYKFILEELQLAKKLLATVEIDKTEITANAALALEARVKLYMSDWSGAYNAATKIIAGGDYPLVAADAENFVNMWHNDDSSEDILQLYVESPSELSNTIGGFGADASKGVCKPDWLPTKWMINLYEDKDLRKNVYFDENQITEFKGTFYKGLTVLSKFMGNPALASTTEDPTWGYVPDGRQAPKVLRVAEMYLIAAEAGYMAKKSDAKNYLNSLRESRGLDPVATSGDALLNDIKEERTRELAYEGFRLWDLRRWNESIARKEPQKATIIVPSLDDKETTNTIPETLIHLEKGPNNYYYLNVDTGNNKWIWGIPANDIKINENLVQNPGW